MLSTYCCGISPVMVADRCPPGEVKPGSTCAAAIGIGRFLATFPRVTVEDLIARLRPLLDARDDVRFAVLFGSAATRGPEHARDIDVAVSFTQTPTWAELARLAADLEALTGRDVDLVDVDQATTLLRWEVVKAARPIVVHQRQAWIELLARVPIEHADLRPYFERESRGLRRALEETRWSKSTSSATRSDD